VIPRSARTSVGGERDGRLVVRVTAPPVDGKANNATLVALAQALAVPVRSLRIVLGDLGRNKTVEVSGLSLAELQARLSDHAG